MVVVVVGAWTAAASRGPRSLRIYEGLLGCLLRVRQLLLLLRARLRLARWNLQIVARELARLGANVLVLCGLVLDLDRLLLGLIRPWRVDDDAALVAFVRLPDRTDLSTLPSTHLLCLTLLRLVHCTHVGNSLIAVHLPKVASRRLIELLMFLILRLQEVPSHVLLILLLLLIGGDLVLNCALRSGSGRLLLLLLPRLLLEEVALGHLLLHLQLLLLLDAEELIRVLRPWAIHMHLVSLLLHVLDGLLGRVVLLRGRWVMVD